jgi:hypothetical protein
MGDKPLKALLENLITGIPIRGVLFVPDEIILA